MKEYFEALNSFENAIKIDLNFGRSIYYKGVTLMNLKRFEDAVSTFLHLVQLYPKDPDAWGYIANGNRILKKNREEIQAWDEIIKIRDEKGLKSQHALQAKAQALVRNGSYFSALQCFDEAKQLCYSSIKLREVYTERWEAVKKLQKQIEKKVGECLSMCGIARRLFLVMRNIFLPPEIRIAILENVREKDVLDRKEWKALISYASNIDTIGETQMKFYSMVGLEPSITYLKREIEKEVGEEFDIDTTNMKVCEIM